MKKLLSILLCTVIVLALTPVTAFAATEIHGAFRVTMPANGNATLNNTVLEIKAGGDYTISMASVGSRTNQRIQVSDTAVDVEITLKGVSIDAAGGPALQIPANANVTLILEDVNYLKGADTFAGINVPDTANLTIQKSTANGSLEATGGKSAAGIGGNIRETSGSVTIVSGTVIAKGGDAVAGGGGGGGSGSGSGSGGGAGIGGGGGVGGDDGNAADAGDGGRITIIGGTVTAKGGDAVGSGSGSGNSGGGAGIGGGGSGGSNSIGGDGGDIEIRGGDVTATGGGDGAGIGGGSNGDNISKGGDGGTIKISGGAVTATGGSNGAGIGGGNGGDGGSIIISDGKVTAKGGNGGAGIGGGFRYGDIFKSGDGGNITISGGAVTATGGNGGAGIGGGSGGDGGTIEIRGGAVTATGGENGAGIGDGSGGDGSGGDGGSITISEGSVIANGGLYAAGIGGGNKGGGGTIKINGGKVKATGGGSGAGIGGGVNGGGGDITIGENAIVAAFGGKSKYYHDGAGAGIGGGGGIWDGNNSISAGAAGSISIAAPGVHALGGMNYDETTRNTAVGGGSAVSPDGGSYSYVPGALFDGITENDQGELLLYYNEGSPTDADLAKRAADINEMLNPSPTPEPPEQPARPEQAKPPYLPGAVGGNMSAVSAFIGDAALQYAAYHGDRVIAFLDNNPSSYARKLIAGAKPYAYSGSTRIGTFEIYIPLPIASDLQAALISMGAERVTIDDRAYLRLYY